MHLYTRASRSAMALALATITFLALAAPALAQTEEINVCGITPESARAIAAEIMRQAGNPYDSISAAYYVSVLAPRLSPFWVVFFMRHGFVVGEIEVDLCGRQDTPHPGVQYSEHSDLRADSLLLEPDRAFKRLRQATGAEPVFASRVFPYGIMGNEVGWGGVDFWWMILDDQAHWHYMSKVGEIIDIHRRPRPEPSADSAAAPGKP